MNYINTTATRYARIAVSVMSLIGFATYYWLFSAGHIQSVFGGPIFEAVLFTVMVFALVVINGLVQKLNSVKLRGATAATCGVVVAVIATGFAKGIGLEGFWADTLIVVFTVSSAADFFFNRGYVLALEVLIGKEIHIVE